LDIHQIKGLLEKYQQGACTEAESILIEDWLASIKNDQPNHFSNNFIEDQLIVTKNRIDELIGTQPVFNRKMNHSWMAIAASVLIVAGSSIAIWISYSKKPNAKQLVKQPGIEKHIINGLVYVQTHKGITDNITLADGSSITLNASSKLRYPLKFTGHKRPVYLDEGEALFNVAKDKSSPFTVYTNKFATTALGTAFNIRSYAKEHKVSISLIHGKIRIDDLHPAVIANSSKILLPHQQLVFNKSGGLLKTDFKDETSITSWKEGILSFSNASMDEVINSIENRFNVEIKNHSKNIDWSYTGTFRDEPLNDVINTVCLTEGITFSINKNIITLN
jgi:transmembrane sensor